jgi:hypothetical protein
LPAPESSGVTDVGGIVVIGLAPAEYGGAVAATDEVVESALTFPKGAGIAALTAGVVGEETVGALFIEVGPISVVLNGVSPLLGGGAAEAPGFSDPGPTTGAP